MLPQKTHKETRSVPRKFFNNMHVENFNYKSQGAEGLSQEAIGTCLSCLRKLFLNDFPHLLIEMSRHVSIVDTPLTDKQKKIFLFFLVGVYFVLFQSGSSHKRVNPSMQLE